jgi:hypothetical protein
VTSPAYCLAIGVPSAPSERTAIVAITERPFGTGERGLFRRRNWRQIGGYARDWKDAVHVGVDRLVSHVGCMNIRATSYPQRSLSSREVSDVAFMDPAESLVTAGAGMSADGLGVAGS